MPCILLQISGERGIDAAVPHNSTVKRANECSPAPGKFIALYPKTFSKLFPGQGLTPVDKLAKGSAFETWIKKIDSIDDVEKPKQETKEPKRDTDKHKPDKRKKTCQAKLNNGEHSDTKVSLMLLIYQDVKDAIIAESTQRGYTISGFVETVLVDWLNANEDRKQKFIKSNEKKSVILRTHSVRSRRRSMRYLGRLSLRSICSILLGRN